MFKFNKWMSDGFKTRFEDNVMVYVRNLAFVDYLKEKCFWRCLDKDIIETIMPAISIVEYNKLMSVNSVVRKAGLQPLVTRHRSVARMRRFERYVVVYGRSFVGLYRVGKACTSYGCIPCIVVAYHVFVGEMFFSEDDKRKVLGFLKYLVKEYKSKEYVAVFKKYNPDFIRWMVEPVGDYYFYRVYSTRDFPEIEVVEKPVERIKEKW